MYLSLCSLAGRATVTATLSRPPILWLPGVPCFLVAAARIFPPLRPLWKLQFQCSTVVQLRSSQEIACSVMGSWRKLVASGFLPSLTVCCLFAFFSIRKFSALQSMALSVDSTQWLSYRTGMLRERLGQGKVGIDNTRQGQEE